MKSNKPNAARFGRKLTRRQFIGTGIVLTASALLGACGLRLGGDGNAPAAKPEETATRPAAGGAADKTQTATLAPTPSCGEDHDPTPELTEGPYYTPNTPERTSLLEQGIKGTKLTLTGYVVTTDCKPVKRALLDFWHADADGEYDNEGYKLRGHQYTDDNGKFQLETIVPGLYPGRTRHIHVKVQAPSKKILTTQLFFPGEAGNAKDRIYNKELLMSVKEIKDGNQEASYQFVVKT